MASPSKNYITAESKSPDSSATSATILIDLADDFSEVRGFGQPIPISLAKKMAKDYYDSFNDVLEILDFIDKNQSGVFDSIKADSKKNEQFDKLKMMMNPANHIVSGVFGKEIILQTLAQKNCEGIRYMIGRDSDNKMTVILAGVKETNYPNDNDNYTTKATQNGPVKIRKSEILPFAQYFKDVVANQPSKSKDPTVPEVHLASLTVKELKAILDRHADLNEDANEVLFGEF